MPVRRSAAIGDVAPVSSASSGRVAARGAPVGPASAGFSLMEVLVALVLAAILGLALLGAQYQSFKLAQSSRAVWEGLNVAEEFFVRQYPDGLKQPTAGEAAWTERKDVHFRLVLDPPRDGVRWYSLSLRTPGGVTGWDWPEPKVEWKSLPARSSTNQGGQANATGASK